MVTDQTVFRTQQTFLLVKKKKDWDTNFTYQDRCCGQETSNCEKIESDGKYSCKNLEKQRHVDEGSVREADGAALQGPVAGRYAENLLENKELKLIWLN
jgi:hypothetical protein